MGNWTCFALMGLAGVCVCFLWYKLGSSSEYQGSVEQEDASVTGSDEHNDKDVKGELAAGDVVRVA